MRKNTLIVLLVCCILFGCNQTATEPQSQPTDLPTLAPSATPPPEPTFTPTTAPTATEPPTPTPTQAPSPTPDIDTSDWETYLDPENGFEILLPHTWIYFDLGENHLEASFASVTSKYPELGNVFTLDGLRNFAGLGAKLIALNTDFLGSNLSIIMMETIGEITFDEFLDYNLEGLRTELGQDLDISQEAVQLGELDAVKIRYQAYSDGMNLLAFQQYLMLNGQTQIYLTFTSPLADETSNTQLFMEIAQTFKRLN